MSRTDGTSTVVVLGGAGFIGSTLVDSLLATGWRVVAIDSFEPYYDRPAKERNLAQAAQHRNFRLVEADTRDRGALSEAIAAAKPAVVVDLAARAGVRPSLANPELYVDINVKGLQNTLAAVTDVGARLVFASSSSVYGNDPRQPFREEQMRCQPESPYGATKIAGEALIHAHHVTTGLPVAVARLFTVYGPRQRPDLAIHKFAARMLAGEPIDLYDQGRALRDYTFVEDIVTAFQRLIEVDRPYTLVNVGSHRPVATVEMVELLESSMGLKVERRLLPAQAGDVPATYADISRASDLLDWRPRWSFEDGVAAFCDWFRAQDRARAS